jgi:hypothetical protein
MSVSAIRQKLLTKFSEMQSIKAAYDWETSNSDGNYPFATITLREGSGEFGSQSHNIRRRGFSVRIYQERSKIGQGPETAEDISTDIIDEFEAALDMDTTLSGTVKYVEPISWSAGYIDRELDTRILEIEINAIDIVDSI